MHRCYYILFAVIIIAVVVSVVVVIQNNQEKVYQEIPVNEPWWHVKLFSHRNV